MLGISLPESDEAPSELKCVHFETENFLETLASCTEATSQGLNSEDILISNGTHIRSFPDPHVDFERQGWQILSYAILDILLLIPLCKRTFIQARRHYGGVRRLSN